jgi:hypothetical protein
VALVRSFRSTLGAELTEVPLQFPAGYPPDALEGARQLFANRLPDLSSGRPALGDALVAIEWLHTEWPVLTRQGYGRFLAINCRDWGREHWDRDERLSLQRGLVAVRTPVPLWILQAAGQQVETWGLPGDHPIFTEHVTTQFTWMLEVSPDRGDALRKYEGDSGLRLSDGLRHVLLA